MDPIVTVLMILELDSQPLQTVFKIMEAGFESLCEDKFCFFVWLVKLKYRLPLSWLVLECDILYINILCEYVELNIK